MKKSYVYLGVIVLVIGYILSESMGEAADGFIVISVVLIAYGIFYSNIKVKTSRLSSPVPESISPPPPAQEENVYYCKECGNPLTYIGKYKKWYCYSCEEYA